MSENAPIEIRSDNYFAAFPHWVLDLKLSSSAVHLYICLLSFANWKTKMGRPSRQTLANLMQCSIKTVDRAKDELVENGLLTYSQRVGTSNFYTVITANPTSDKYDIGERGRDKNDIGGSDKNDILTKVNNYIKDTEPKGSAVQRLVALYVDNYVGEFPPNAAETGKNLKRLLEAGHTAERLAELIPGIASSGRKISQGTLSFEASQQAPKPADAPTPTPPRFDPSEYQKGDPMPANIRELVRLARKNATEGD